MGMTPRVRFVFCILCALFLLSIAMALYVPDAHAQAMCAQYKELQAALLEHNHEAPTGVGLSGQKLAYTIFTTPDGASWTMVVVDTSGKACVLAVGQNWVDIAPGKGDPT